MAEKIPVFKPALDEAEMTAAREALEMGWLGMGSYVDAFERALEGVIGAEDRHVVAVSTGHAALHLALLLARVGPGDEVITPSFNNVADFQAILATGAVPVFCDIDDTSLGINLDEAAQLVSNRTKAMIVMDYDCILADHERAQDFAARYSLRVVHDAAHSLGSTYRGKKVGSFSDLTMFSFDPVKTVTCIDGGALVVRSREEMQRLHEMRLIGMCQPAEVMYTNARAWTYDVAGLGFRYHMANLHAAIGLRQLAKLDAMAETRRAACRRYNAALAGIPQITVPKTDFAEVTPFLYYIRVPGQDRQTLRQFLTEHGVDTGIHWQPGHHFTLFKDCRRGDLSVTERVSSEVVSLPLHSFMRDETIDRVVEAIAGFYRAR